MTNLVWHGREYSVNNLGGKFGIHVQTKKESKFLADAEEAWKWLASRSLRKGKAKQLVATEMSK